MERLTGGSQGVGLGEGTGHSCRQLESSWSQPGRVRKDPDVGP